MAIQFLLDEHLRGPLWLALLRHNLGGGDWINVERVGDPQDLPLASRDEAILLWAERDDRVLVTEDKHSMPLHLANHLQAGHRSPGVLMIRPGFSISQLVSILDLIAQAGEPADYENAISYIP